MGALLRQVKFGTGWGFKPPEPAVNVASLVPTGWGTISVFKQVHILCIVTILQTKEKEAQRD